MNANKCEVMVFERSECKTACEIKIGNVALEQVDEFVYLGSLLSRNGKAEDDVCRRVRVADRMNGAFMEVVKNRNI